MLLDFKIKERFYGSLAGVIHDNQTARIQTIFEKSDNPFMFDLLQYLNKNYNILGLINTSFNKRGEPIIQTTADALKSGKSLNLDAVVLNGEYKDLKI